MVLTICSVYLGVSPPGWVSTRNQFTCGSCHMTICPSRMCPLLVRSTLLSPHVLVLSSRKSVQLGVCLFEFCPSWGSGHMTFFPRRIVSTIDSVNSAFRSCLVLSSWKFVQLGACLLEFCLFWESGHMIFCPCSVVSIIVTLNSRFC